MCHDIDAPFLYHADAFNTLIWRKRIIVPLSLIFLDVMKPLLKASNCHYNWLEPDEMLS